MHVRNRRSRIITALVLGLTLVTSLLAGVATPAQSLARPAEQVAPGSGGPVPSNPPANPDTNNIPQAVDAFAFLSPCNLTVTQGMTFTLDLLINAGTNNVVGQQSYLTFTQGLLQVIQPGFGCGAAATTVQTDLSTFEVSLQNQVDNTNGLISYASGTFGSGATGVFRVARLNFCALASGTATINWQFSPPAPPQRNSKITDDQSATVSNPALYTNCAVTIVGGATPTATATRTATSIPTNTPSNTPTNTPVVPTGTPTNTPTNTPVVPTNTATNTPTRTVVPPTSTATNTPTNTAVVPTSTATNTPTNTAVVPTNTATNTPTRTVVPPTSTATNTPTNTAVVPTNTATNTPTNTAVPPTRTATNTPTNTAVVPTSTATNTPTNTAVVPTNTATNTPTNTVPPTVTRTSVPPTLTNTAVPPTVTRTPAPPTATRTPAPPTATATLPPPPPTATATLPPPPPTGTVCPTGTPTPVVTPAFTPSPGCSAIPRRRDLRAVITDHPGYTEATFTNRSATCSYPIGLATYKKFDNNIDHQELFDWTLAIIPPNSTLVLRVNNPPCAYQGDAFWGNLIQSFAGGVRYGERRLDDTDGLNPVLCTRCGTVPADKSTGTTNQ